MIPIEELKQNRQEYTDHIQKDYDTYWGIETIVQLMYIPIVHDYDTYWGIETNCTNKHLTVKYKDYDTYWGIETF